MTELLDLNYNYLARIVISCFEDAGFDDYYIESKKEKLAKHNKYDTLLWCALSLDTNNTKRFAEKCEVSEADLITTFKTIRKIERS